jgi:hypothetical protein
VTARRSVLSGVLAAAAIAPALFWLSPALVGRQAPSFRDQGDFFYPLKLYTADRLRRGELPLWNPLSGMGEPWLANLQSGVFYPPSLLFLLSSPALAAGLFLLLHFAIAAWGMRRFLREEAVSEEGALFGAALFCASGLAASLSAYWNHFGSWAYIPGVLALARSGLPTRLSRVGLAVLVGLQAMAGSPELTGATLACALLFSFFTRPTGENQWAEVSPGRSASRLAIAALLGLALSAWALLPMGELLLHSDRRGALPVEDRENGVAGAAAASSALGLTDGGATSYLSSLYFGPLALLAAAAGCAERQRRKLAGLLLLLACTGLLVSAAGPPGSWLRSLPPLDRVRYPSKALSLTAFALAVLAGLGTDGLRFGVARGKRRLVLLVAGAAAALALYAASPLAPAVAWAGAAGIAALLALGLVREARAGATLEALAGLALTVSLALAGRPFFTFVAEAEIRRSPADMAPLTRTVGRVLTPPMQDLARWALASGNFGPEALHRQREALLGYTNLLLQIPTVRTAAALPTRGARSIIQSVDTAAEPALAAGPASARILWTPFRPVRLPSQKIGDFFRVPLAPYRPRLSFVHAFRVEPDPEKAWRQAAGGGIDLTREVYLDREPQERFAGDASKQLLVARLAEDLPERVAADITSNRPGLLVLTDLAYPGWSVLVDGKDAEMRTADGFFRAVPLAAGSHRVVFRYRPLSVAFGAAVSLTAAAILLLRLWLGRRDDARSLL